MKRESFNVEQDVLNNYSKTRGSHIVNGEEYKIVDKIVTGDIDGAVNTEIIVQRETDKKYFSFTYSYYHDREDYEPSWVN